jgi:translocation and assembly module TamB
MIKRLLKFIGLIVAFGIIFTVLVIGISSTDSGSRWFVQWLIKTNDVPISIEKIEGSLFDTFYLYDLAYDDKKGTEVTLGKLAFDWSPADLIGFKVQINYIDLKSLSYHASADSSNESIKLPELTYPSLPFAVSIDQLNLHNTRILVNGNQQAIQNIKASVMMNETELSFQLKEFISGQQRLYGNAVLINNTNTEIEAELNWQGELQQEAGQGSLSIKGQQNNLAVNLNMDSVIDAKVYGNVNLKNQPYAVELNGEIQSKLYNAYSDDIVLDSPVGFNLMADMDQFSGSVDTHAQFSSGEGFAFKLEVDGVIPGEKYNTLNMNVDWKTIPDSDENGFLFLKGLADFEYTDQVLHIDHELESPSIVTLQGNVNFATEVIDLSMHWDKVTIPVSEGDFIKLHAGLINTSGKLDSFAVSFETEYLVTNDVNTEKKSYDKVSAQGEVNLLTEYPTGQLTGTLKTAVPENIQNKIESIGPVDFIVQSKPDSVEVNITSDLYSNEGQIYDFVLNGNLDLTNTSFLAIDANANFQLEPLGPINLDLNARWTDSILTIESFKAGVLDGKLEASGALNLQNEMKGEFELKGHHLNIGLINPDLESQIDLNADIMILESSAGLSTEIDMTSLSGEWRGFPLLGTAQFAYADNVYRIEKLNLNSGNNIITMSLRVDKLLSGFVDLSVQDLSLLSSELDGKIEGRMDISGNINSPNIQGKLNGTDLFINDVRIISFHADSNIDLRPQQHSSFNLKLKSLNYQNHTFDEVLIKGQGLTESHQLEILASGPELSVNAIVNAGLNNKKWSGRFAQLDIKNSDAGLWEISSPSNFDWQVQDSKFDLQKTCLSQEVAHLCITAAGKSTKDINGEVDVSRLPLSFIEPMLPETMLLKGDVSGNAKFDLLDNNWKLTAEIVGNDTGIGAGYDDEPVYIDIDVASFKLNADKNDRALDIKLSSKEYFDISLAGSMKDKGERPLEGKLVAVLEEIDWLQNLEPTLTGSYGKFQANIIAGGTIDQPSFDGQFSLTDGLLSVLPIGLMLDKINGKIHSNDASKEIQINSLIASNDKELSVNGRVSLFSEKGYPYELDIVGENFPVVRTTDISMDVSPEINIKGTKESHYIRGKFGVPLLDLKITSIPDSAVKISPDVEIIESKQPGAIQVVNGNGSNDFITNHLDIDINVLLNPDIHIRGFGLDTRLSGDINIIKPLKIYQPRGEGQVNITNGSYRAYGQNLEVDTGILQFAGPLDNPGISVSAYRPNLPIKAGVNISGNVRQPKVTLVSVPAQTEADTLSYLMTGRPLSGASGSEASLIAQAALSLGVQESSVLTKEVQNTFGLDEVSITGGETLEDSSLTIGKNLSQKLSMRTEYNPFEEVFTLLLNYKLTDNWSVQTESGVTQGADIVYSVESNSIRDLFDRFLDIIKFN